jgi:hypothetical protein
LPSQASSHTAKHLKSNERAILLARQNSGLAVNSVFLYGVSFLVSFLLTKKDTR